MGTYEENFDDAQLEEAIKVWGIMALCLMHAHPH
jgi:hypothetical protein